MTTKRSVAPHHRMNGGYSKRSASSSVHAREVHCADCGWSGMRMDADDPCGKCGGVVVLGTKSAARAMRRLRPQSCGIVGERSPIEEAETNRLLAEAREAAGR